MLATFQKQYRESQVDQPLMMVNFTAGMAGVNLMDLLLGVYCPHIKGNELWWPLFVNTVNMVAVSFSRLGYAPSGMHSPTVL